MILEPMFLISPKSLYENLKEMNSERSSKTLIVKNEKIMHKNKKRR